VLPWILSWKIEEHAWSFVHVVLLDAFEFQANPIESESSQGFPNRKGEFKFEGPFS
jgi:hypothetical protein